MTWWSALLRWLVSLGVIAAASWYFYLVDRRVPMLEKEIYRGVFYGCQRLAPDEQGRGLMHWVRIDLTAPGIELYVSPTDPEAIAAGYHYKLRYVHRVVQEQNLSVGINSTLYHAEHYPFVMPGDLALAGETAISNGQISNEDPHSYMLWFDDKLTPHMETRKPPSATALANARWAISSQGIVAAEGQVRGGKMIDPEQRTSVGVDVAARELWLAVFENVSERRAAEELVSLGAKYVLNLDSGHASCMAIGSNSRHIRSGTVHTGYVPVAPHFGVRAQPLD